MIISLKCSCGAIRGEVLDPEHAVGKRIVCMCVDCQAYAFYLGRAQDILDANGGTDVCPVTPSNLKITAGMESLKCLRLSDKGMLRWYAGCCKTPIANTVLSAKFPFAGVIHSIFDLDGKTGTRDEVLGPIYARVKGKFAFGRLPGGSYQTAPLRVIVTTIRFIFSAWVKGQHSPSPFFDARTGKPKVEPYILTAAERDNLRSQCGPKPEPLY